MGGGGVGHYDRMKRHQSSNRYPETVDDCRREWTKFTQQPPYEFADAISRYLWNGWGTTLLEAAQRLVRSERDWARTHEPSDPGRPLGE